MKSRALDEGNRGKPKEVEKLLEQPNYLVEEKYPTPPELFWTTQLFLCPPLLPVRCLCASLSAILCIIPPVAPASGYYSVKLPLWGTRFRAILSPTPISVPSLQGSGIAFW